MVNVNGIEKKMKNGPVITLNLNVGAVILSIMIIVMNLRKDLHRNFQLKL